MLLLVRARIVDIYDIDVNYKGANVEEMHDATHNVVVTSVGVPFKLDKLLDGTGVVDCELFAGVQEAHEIDVSVVEYFLVGFWIFVDDMLTNTWKNVH